VKCAHFLALKGKKRAQEDKKLGFTFFDLFLISLG
jgi:hypothetical protein